MSYLLDKTGVASANLIRDEHLVLSTTGFCEATIPENALFYRRGFFVYTAPNRGGESLQEGVDFSFILPSSTISAYWGHSAYGGIMLYRKDLRDLYFQYQTVGGDYALNGRTPKLDKTKPGQLLRFRWEDILTTLEPDAPDLTLHTATADTLQTGLKNLTSINAKILQNKGIN